MHAAAAHKGGVAGVSQAVGKEFSDADKPGKLPARKSRSERMGYSRGGSVEAPKSLKTGGKAGYVAGGVVESMAKSRDVAAAQKEESYNEFMQEQARQNALEGKEATPWPGAKAKGGKIREVAGKPIGKDDGLIPAQRGEFVVRKSAVKKLGTAALETINKGRLPNHRSEKMYGRKGISRG